MNSKSISNLQNLIEKNNIGITCHKNKCIKYVIDNKTKNYNCCESCRDLIDLMIIHYNRTKKNDNKKIISPVDIELITKIYKDEEDYILNKYRDIVLNDNMIYRLTQTIISMCAQNYGYVDTISNENSNDLSNNNISKLRIEIPSENDKIEFIKIINKYRNSKKS